MTRLLALVAFLAVASIANAQTTPSINFVLDVTTQPGQVVPKLTWSTTPAASSCTGAGDVMWQGPKAASGTQTLAPTNKSATYRIDCVWGAATSTVLTWVVPTQNTDGSAFTGGLGYRIRYSLVTGTPLD